MTTDTAPFEVATTATDHTQDGFLSVRSQGVGASEVGALLGVDPYNSYLSLYLLKTGQTPGFEGNAASRWGDRAEPLIADLFAEDHPEYAVLPAPGVLRSREHPRLLASPDRPLAAAGHPDLWVSLLECKTASQYQAKHWDVELGLMPPRYYAQIQAQLCVTGLDGAWVGAIIAGADPVFMQVQRDQVLIDTIVERVEDFWSRIEDRDEPDFDFTPQSVEALEAVRRQAGKAVVVDSRAEVVAAHLADIKARKAELTAQVRAVEAEEKVVKGEALALLGDGEVAVTADGRTLWTYKEQSRKAQAASTFRVFRLST